jgi:hypothetical protein
MDVYGNCGPNLVVRDIVPEAGRPLPFLSRSPADITARLEELKTTTS